MAIITNEKQTLTFNRFLLSFFFSFQITSSVFAASFHIVVGIALSFSAVLVPQLEDPKSDIPVTKKLTSIVASIIVLMVPLGSLIAGYTMDKFGRVNTIKLAAIPSIIGLMLIATAPNIYFIIAGRIFTGISCAMGSSPAVVYITGLLLISLLWFSTIISITYI
jgi:facilitated trehalose transporter